MNALALFRLVQLPGLSRRAQGLVGTWSLSALDWGMLDTVGQDPVDSSPGAWVMTRELLLRVRAAGDQARPPPARQLPAGACSPVSARVWRAAACARAACLGSCGMPPCMHSRTSQLAITSHHGPGLHELQHC